MLKFLFPNYSKCGKGIDRNAPKKTGVPLFIETFTREFTSLLKLNFIFLICCIPIITIGPAIGGMTNVTLKMVKDEPSDVFYDFKDGFKKNFKQSFVLSLIIVIMSCIIACAFLYYIQLQGFSYYCLMLFIGFTALVFMMSCIYIYPMAVGVELPIKSIVRNSLILSITSIRNSIVTIALSLAVFAIGYMIRVLKIPLILMFFSFSFCSFVSSFCAWSAIEKNVIR